MAADPERPAGPDAEAELENLLAPVLDLAAAAQPRALEVLCAAHPALADALRRRHAVLARFGLASENGTAALRLGLADEPAPARLGPFRIVRTLGRGGMGIVYLAEDPALGRTVALKLIRPELLHSERARQRFQREVAIAAKLDHPGLCTVHGAGEVEGQPYLVLRYVDGDSLEHRLQVARAGRHGALGVGQRAAAPVRPAAPVRAVDLTPTLRLVEALARALHVAHEAGLVHRDVKPGNVMVARDGSPVLMDFGLARDTESSAAELTETTDAVGTPAYMAPEQVRGDAVDRRTDVHALGALLYECLTLRPPYVGRSREDLYRSILTDQPIEVRRLEPAATRDLATVVHVALAKSPQQRYPTALALAEDLRAVIEGRPTRVRPPGAVARAWSWITRHRAAAAVAAAVLVGLASSLTLLVRSMAAEQRSRAVALVARASAFREDPELAFAVLQEALATSPEPEVVAAMAETLAELPDIVTLRVAPGRMESVSRSPSGRWLVVAGQNDNATIHRADGSLWRELPWPIMPQRPAIAFSPDETEVLVSHRDGVAGAEYVAISLCDLRDPARAPAQFGGAIEKGIPNAIAWDARGRIAVTYAGRPRVFVFDDQGVVVNEDQKILQPPGARGCAFLPDGRLVVASGIWSVDSGVCEVPFRSDPLAAPIGRVVHILLHGDRILVADTGGVRGFDLDGKDLWPPRRRWLASPSQELTTLSVAADGALLATFRDGQVWLWDAAGNLQTWSEGGTVASAHFAPDGQQIVAADWKGRVTVRNRAGDELHSLQGHQNGAFCAPLADGTGRILTASWDGSVKLWSPGRARGGLVLSGFPRATLLAHEDRLLVAAKDGRLLAIDAEGRVQSEARVPEAPQLSLHEHREPALVWVLRHTTGELWQWTPATGRLEASVRTDYGNHVPMSLGHLADGRLLGGSGWHAHPLQVIDPVTGTSQKLAKLNTTHVAAARAGEVAVSIDGWGLLRVHDGNGEMLWQEPDPDAAASGGRTRDATCLVLSRDGRRAAIGMDDGSVSLWDLPARARLERWMDHRSRVRSVAISADGSRVASVTSPGHLVVRAIGHPTPLLQSHLHGESLESVVFFGPDAVMTGGWRNSGRLRWWWWDPEVLARQVARVPPVELSAEQRRLLAETLAAR